MSEALSLPMTQNTITSFIVIHCTGGASVRRPHQQRRHLPVSLHQDKGRLRDAVRGEPPGPLPTHPPASGPPETLNPQPHRGGLLQTLQARPHRLRGPEQRAKLQQGLRLQPQQTGQPAVHPRAGSPPGGQRGDCERSDPRHREDQPGEARPHPAVGEATV